MTWELLDRNGKSTVVLLGDMVRFRQDNGSVSVAFSRPNDWEGEELLFFDSEGNGGPQSSLTIPGAKMDNVIAAVIPMVAGSRQQGISLAIKSDREQMWFLK